MDVTARQGANAPDPFDPERSKAFPGWIEPALEDPAAVPAPVTDAPDASADGESWPTLEPGKPGAGLVELDPAVKAAYLGGSH